MAKYLLMASYTGEAWAAQVKNPQNRVELVRPVFERMGGSMELAYGSFGESDIVIIMDMPDNISAAAISIAFFKITLSQGESEKTPWKNLQISPNF